MTFPGKGDLNPDFGFIIERPFYIVSQLEDNRYLDIVNNYQVVTKIRNGRNTQQWWFDQTTLTVKTKWNNQSLEL